MKRETIYSVYITLALYKVFGNTLLFCVTITPERCSLPQNSSKRGHTLHQFLCTRRVTVSGKPINFTLTKDLKEDRGGAVLLEKEI